MCVLVNPVSLIFLVDALKCIDAFHKILKYLYELKYHEKPDYVLIRKCFLEILSENGFEADNRYDWVVDIEVNK
jgi:hypothetical protein